MLNFIIKKTRLDKYGRETNSFKTIQADVPVLEEALRPCIGIGDVFFDSKIEGVEFVDVPAGHQEMPSEDKPQPRDGDENTNE